MKNLLLFPFLFLMLAFSTHAQDDVYLLKIKGSVGIQKENGTPTVFIPNYQVVLSDISFLVPFVTDSTGHFEFTYDFPVGTQKEVTVSIVDICTGKTILKKFKSTDQEVQADFIICENIVVPPDTGNCMAYFGHENGEEPFSVKFTDLSFGDNINNWNWDFGDGVTSTEQHPYHIYNDNGTYEIKLTISSDDCKHTIEKFIKVTEDCNCPDIWDPVCIATPSGGFISFGNECEANCQGYTSDMLVSCNSDTTECFVNIRFVQNPQNLHNFKFFAQLDLYGSSDPLSVTKYSWNFGDGTYSTDGSEVGHEYTQNGTYNVTLLVETEHTACETEVQITIDDCVCPDVYAPVCVLTSAGVIINFENSCQAECAGYSSSQFVSCEPNNECYATIQLSKSPTDDLLSVQLNAVMAILPINEVNYFWEFGDGTTESGTNPSIVHTYAEEGNYIIVLTVDLGQNNICKTNIEVSIPFEGDCICPLYYAPVCVKTDTGESISFNNFCFAQCEGYTQADLIDCDTPNNCDHEITAEVADNQMTILFNTTNVEPNTENTTVKWEFGDGTTGKGTPIKHEYTEEGTFIVQVTIINANGEACYSKIEITVPLGDDCICPEVWAPVCVKTPNGIITFGNFCEAECEGYTQNDIVSCQPDSCFAVINAIQTEQWDIIYFTAISFAPEPSTADKYNWNFGDGTTGEGQFINHKYEKKGEYTITLTVTTEEGQRCETEIILDLKPEIHPCDCPDVWEPVCVATLTGIFTFGNFCEAECAGYTQNDIVPCNDEQCEVNIIVTSNDPMTLNFTTDYPISILDSILVDSSFHVDVIWDFGDGTTETNHYVSHTYTKKDTYIVTVKVKGENIECVGRIKVTVPWDEGCVCADIYDPVCVQTESGTTISFPNACTAICDGYDQFVPCDTIENCRANIWYNISNDNPLSVSYFVETLNPTNPDTRIVWDFGDGNTSTELSPTHTYEIGGIYEVTVILDNEECIAEGWSIVFVHDGPWFPEDCQAIFDAYSINNTATMFQFKDLSQGDIVSWSWSFGDGETSEDQHPVHSFVNEGLYEVVLTINTSDDCSSKIYKTVRIGDDYPIDSTQCQAIFGYFQTATSTYTVNFEDYSFGDINTWAWDFGDGTTSTDPNPVHIYSEAGVYEVTLKITTHEICESKVTQKVLVTDEDIYPLECQAFFFFEIDKENKNIIHFQDLSYNEVEEWNWSFGDGQISTEQNPTHKYAEPGYYIVHLKIKTATCREEFKMEIYIGDDIVIPDDCVALFTGVFNGLEVSFQDLSTSLTPTYEWHWNFGDGETSSVQNPVHIYAELGVYEVILTIKSQACEAKFLMNVDLFHGEFEGRPFAAYETTATKDVETVIEHALISPNPVSHAAFLTFEASSREKLNVNVISLTGSTVHKQTLQTKIGTNKIEINTSDLNSGIYFVQIQSKDGVNTLKFIRK